MPLPIFPFVCDDVQVKLGLSCEKQKEIQDSFNNLSKNNTLTSAFSVGSGGSGFGSDPLGLNYEKEQKILSEKLSEQAKQDSFGNIAKIQDENKNKDKYLYAIALIIVLGVVIYEFKNKKL